MFSSTSGDKCKFSAELTIYILCSKICRFQREVFKYIVAEVDETDGEGEPQHIYILPHLNEIDNPIYLVGMRRTTHPEGRCVGETTSVD